MFGKSRGLFTLLLPALFITAAPRAATAPTPQRTFLMLASAPAGTMDSVM